MPKSEAKNAALPISASGNTISGDLPPSSKDKRFMCAADLDIILCPVAVDPVKASILIPG